jgi:hypothetical protein
MGELYIKDVDLELLEKQRKHLNKIIDWLDDRDGSSLTDAAMESIRGLTNMLDAWADARYFKQQEREKYLAQLISYSSPMTTMQAIARYECKLCKTGIGCEHGCIESSTGSYRCPTCNGRVWFNRRLPKFNTMHKCPYCENDLVI